MELLNYTIRKKNVAIFSIFTLLATIIPAPAFAIAAAGDLVLSGLTGATIEAGNQVTYSYTVENTGGAASFLFKDMQQDSGRTFVTANGGTLSGCAADATDLIQCNPVTIGANTTETYNFIFATTAPDACGKNTLDGEIALFTTGENSNTTNDTAVATSGITCTPTPAPMCNGKTATIYIDSNSNTVVGGSEDGNPYTGQVIRGTSGDDVFVGTDGDDIFYGEAGDDTICGLDGNDDLRGYDGNDYIEGGKGDDNLTGFDGDDEIYGNEGNDQVHGGAGNDTLRGNEGDDVVSGAAGDDFVCGDAGNDSLKGGADDDILCGGDGDDLLRGEGGNDKLDGGAGTDTTNGDAGNDICNNGESVYNCEDTTTVITECSTHTPPPLVMCTPTDADLVAYWNVDEGSGVVANDSTSYNNVGALINGTNWSNSTPTFTYSNPYAAQFDGTNDAIQVADNSGLNFDTTDPFTINAWVNQSANSGYQTIVHNINDSTAAQNGYLLTLHNGIPQLWLINDYSSSNYLVASANSPISANTWHQITATYDGSSTVAGVQIYVDGTSVGVNNVVDSLTGTIASGQPVGIGARSAGALQQFNGTIDDVRIYNDNLSANRISQLAGGNCSTADPTQYDFGDAPTSYGTLLADNGARHTIVSDFTLGAEIDNETDGQPTANADGDDTQGVDDEDGVLFINPIEISTSGSVKVTLNNGASLTDPVLNAWVDWNQNGTLEGGEQIFTDRALSDGENTIHFAVPSSATEGTTYARFRLSTTTGLTPTDAANNGEVEDYEITIVKASSPERMCNGLPATIYVENGIIIGGSQSGTALNTTILGTPGDDVIVGTNATETILGRAGNDTICGFAGDDDLRGEAGNDTILGGKGNDAITGGTGEDTINGEEGNDTINGNDDDDTIRGNEGDDTVSGGAGDDFVCGDAGNDKVYGQNGNDILCGGDGDDTMRGGNGDDKISGGAGTDGIDGDGDNDICIEGENVANCEDTTTPVPECDIHTPPPVPVAICVDTNNLVAHYALDDGSGTIAIDSSGNNKDASLINMDPNTDWITGVIGSNALSFDGADDYVTRSNVSVDGSTGATIAFWFKTDVNNQNLKYAVALPDQTGGTNGFDVHLSGNNTITTWLQTDNSTNGTQASFNYADSMWHHVVGVYDGTTLALYIDGTLANSVPRTGTIEAAANEINIGRFGTFGGNVDGGIDDVRVYSSALNPVQIAALANNCGDTITNPPPPPPTGDLIAKTSSSSTVNAGSATTLSFTVENTGLTPVEFTFEDFVVPNGYTYNSVNGGDLASCTVTATKTLDCNTITLAGSDTETYNFIFDTAAPNACGDSSITTNLQASAGLDSDSTNNSFNETSTVSCPDSLFADIIVSSGAAITTTYPDTVAYEFNVHNTGSGSATVYIDDLTEPGGLDFVSASGLQNCSFNAMDMLVCDTITVPGGSNHAFSLTFTTENVNACGLTQVTAMADVQSGFNINTTNDTATADATFGCGPDLAVTQVTSNSTPTVGTNFTITYTLSNVGTQTASTITTDALIPANYTLQSGLSSTGTYTSVDGKWNIDSLAPSANETLTLTLTPAANQAGVATTFTGELFSSTPVDPNATNNSASSVITPQAVAVSSPPAVTSFTNNNTGGGGGGRRGANTTAIASLFSNTIAPGAFGGTDPDPSCLEFNTNSTTEFNDITSGTNEDIIKLWEKTVITNTTIQPVPGFNGQDVFRPSLTLNRVLAVQIILGAHCILVPNVIPVPEDGFEFKDLPLDMSLDDPRYEAATIMYTGYINGFVNGTKEGFAKPYNTIILAEALAMVIRLDQLNIDDNNGAQWYSPYLTFSAQNNLLPNNRLQASSELDREEFIVILTNSIRYSIHADLREYISRRLNNGPVADTVIAPGAFGGTINDTILKEICRAKALAPRNLSEERRNGLYQFIADEVFTAYGVNRNTTINILNDDDSCAR